MQGTSERGLEKIFIPTLSQTFSTKTETKKKKRRDAFDL